MVILSGSGASAPDLLCCVQGHLRSSKLKTFSIPPRHLRYHDVRRNRMAGGFWRPNNLISQAGNTPNFMLLERRNDRKAIGLVARAPSLKGCQARSSPTRVARVRQVSERSASTTDVCGSLVLPTGMTNFATLSRTQLQSITHSWKPSYPETFCLRSSTVETSYYQLFKNPSRHQQSGMNGSTLRKICSLLRSRRWPQQCHD